MAEGRRQMAEGRRVKRGKIKRHYEQRRKLIVRGFGSSYKSPQVWFRVEFCWWDRETDEESDYLIHWVACRKFRGEERKFLSSNLEKSKQLPERETVESQWVLNYVVYFLCAKKEELKLNQCFIYPTPSLGNESIRYPLYQIRWSDRLCTHQLNRAIRTSLLGAIEHLDENKKRVNFLWQP